MIVDAGMPALNLMQCSARAAAGRRSAKPRWLALRATLEQLVFVTKMRWRIERDCQDLKQEFGLGHYEGRGWRGFHHHASLSIATYSFLTAQRLGTGSRDDSKKQR
jgi:SRSO17 transposase